MKEFLTLRDFLYQYRGRYLLGIVWLVLVDLLQLVVPRVLGNLADAFTAGTLTRGLLWHYALVVVGVAALVAFFRFLWRMYLTGTARLLEYHLRRRLFNHLLTLSPSFYDRHKTGELMAHATNDIQAVRMSLGMGLVMLTDAVVLSLASVITMITTVNARLTLLALIPMPFLVLVVTHFGKLINKRFRRVQEGFAALSDRVQENIAGIRVVKSFAQEEAEGAAFTATNQENLRRNLDLVRLSSVFYPLVQFLSGVSFFLVLAAGGLMTLQGTISLGDFVAFNSYLALLTWPVMAIGWVINVFQRGAASMARLNAILAEEPTIKDGPEVLPLKPKDLQGEVTLRDLTFTFPETKSPVLQNLTLNLAPGQTLGIIGRTGSGKSTLANLLLRLYDPPQGTIFLDGYELRRLPLQTLREACGYVPQEAVLFSTTIKENIDFSGEHSVQEVVRAAQIAHMHQEVLTFPNGYDTLVGERGITLSGGQRQRVAIARAVIKNPRLLILDDALSAVDSATEAAILHQLRQLRKGRSTVIISHRVAAVQDADQIAVLDQGRLVELGRHQELLERRSLYWRLWQRQRLEERLAQ